MERYSVKLQTYVGNFVELMSGDVIKIYRNGNIQATRADRGLLIKESGGFMPTWSTGFDLSEEQIIFVARIISFALGKELELIAVDSAFSTFEVRY